MRSVVSRRPVVLFVLAVESLFFLVAGSGDVPAAAPGVEDAALHADWPMLARDVQRSGSTPEEPVFPVRRVWLRYFHLEGLMPSVQPVVVGGRIYFGTLSGKFYCVDAATGGDVWTADLRAPVFHTACVAPEGVAAVGTGDGRVVGLDAADGRVLWEFSTAAPLWNAPLPWSGGIYIGGRDGAFYCLDAKSGTLRWKFEAGAPIVQSPALDPQRGQVYFTAEDMVLYALDAATGTLRWRSPKLHGVTARSFHPVIAPDGSVVTATIPFYSWDRCHALLEGVLADLLGTETLDRPATNHPGTYTRYPQWRHTRETNERFERHVRSIFLQPDWFERVEAAMRRAVEADHAAQCLFVFDPAAGKQKYVLPVTYTAFAKSQFMPPVVTRDGRVITKWWTLLPSTFHAYQREVNLAVLDTATGRLAPLFDESRVGSGQPLGLIADESCQLMVAGRWLMNLHNHHGELLSAFDLDDRERQTFVRPYETHSHWYGVGVIHRVLRGQEAQIHPGQEDMTRNVGVASETATGNQLSANMPVVVAGGRIVWMQANKLMALSLAEEPPKFLRSSSIADFGIEELSDEELRRLEEEWPVDWDLLEIRPPNGWGDHKVHTPDRVVYVKGTRQNPDRQAAARAAVVPDEVLDRYIFDVPAPGRLRQTPTVERLRRELAAAVEELLSEPVWMPYRFHGGKHPSDYVDCFTDPTDVLEALALAYPFLPEELPSRTRAYVAAEWRRANPIVENRRYAAGEGAPREPYLVPPDRGRVLSFERELGVERAYAAWLWAHASGEWGQIDPIWDRLVQSCRDDRSRAERDAGNARCAGLIAVCRLARRRGDDRALGEVLPRAREALRARLAHELAHPKGNVVGDQMGLWRGFVRWTFLAPEVGRMLREQAPQSAAPVVREYLDRLRPFWYLTWGPITPESREASVQLPINLMTAFRAQAAIAGATPEQLAVWCDIKACRADPYWITKVALTLRAFAE